VREEATRANVLKFATSKAMLLDTFREEIVQHPLLHSVIITAHPSQLNPFVGIKKKMLCL